MACTCSNNENNKTTKVIRHVFGNVLRISVPLTRRTVEITNGDASYVDEDFTPNLAYPFKVIMTSGPKAIEYDAVLHGTNVAYIEDKGKLAIGIYAITILCSDEVGDPMRFKADFVLRVVDCTSDAYVGGVGWYEGLDGKQTYPVLRSAEPAILVDDDSVTIAESRSFNGSIGEDSVTLRGVGGTSTMMIDNNITITI